MELDFILSKEEVGPVGISPLKWDKFELFSRLTFCSLLKK